MSIVLAWSFSDLGAQLYEWLSDFLSKISNFISFVPSFLRPVIVVYIILSIAFLILGRG